MPKFSAASGLDVVTIFQPARPPLRWSSEAKPAGDVIGRVERGRAGGDEPEMLGDHRQRRQQRERLERRHRMAVLERVERHVEHGQMIGHEERIELAALERLREALEMGEIEIGVGKSAGIAPGAGVDGDRAHESAEMQLP